MCYGKVSADSTEFLAQSKTKDAIPATSVWTHKDHNFKELMLFFTDGFFFLVSNVDSSKSPPPDRASHEGD